MLENAAVRPLFEPSVPAESTPERWWSDLVRQHHPRLIGAVRRALYRHGLERGSDSAEDLAQEVWCRLLCRGDGTRRFRGSSEGEAALYLRRIVDSVVADAARAARAQKRCVDRTLSLEEVGETAARAGDRSSPELRLLAVERRRLLLERCRSALGRRASPLALRVAELALLDGMSSGEIARRLDGRLRPGAIDTLICRLRRRLAAQGVALPRRARGVR